MEIPTKKTSNFVRLKGKNGPFQVKTVKIRTISEYKFKVASPSGKNHSPSKELIWRKQNLNCQSSNWSSRIRHYRWSKDLQISFLQHHFINTSFFIESMSFAKKWGILMVIWWTSTCVQFWVVCAIYMYCAFSMHYVFVPSTYDKWIIYIFRQSLGYFTCVKIENLRTEHRSMNTAKW